MRRLRTLALNWLTAISFVMGAAVIAFWVRSPSIFDRIAWTDSSARYWEVATLWGDFTVVRIAQWPQLMSVQQRSYRFDDRYQMNAEFDPLDGTTFWKDDLPDWGRGFSHQTGEIRVAGKLQKHDLERWAFPLWLPAIVLMTMPAIRLMGWRRKLARQSRNSPGISRGLASRLLAAAPSVVLVMILLLWWRSYWSMDQLLLIGRAKALEMSMLRGQAEASITDPRDFIQFDRQSQEPPPASVPYSDVLGCPSWDHTFRRTTFRYKSFGLQRVTLEPAPWDLMRDDIGLVIFDNLDDGPNMESVENGRITVRFWFLAVLASIIPAWQVYLAIRRHRRTRDGHCAGCGYDLRASTGRCPECGMGFAMGIERQWTSKSPPQC